MAVRSPLYMDGTNVREMTTAMVTQLVHQTCYQYALNPSVTITVTAGANHAATSHFPNINDTRYKTGAAATSTGNSAKGVQDGDFPSEGSLGNPQQMIIPYNKMQRTYASVTPTSDTGKTWPVYRTSDGNIRAMNLTDVKDTILHPAIDLLIAAGTPGDTAGGTYIITTSSTPATGFSVVSGGNVVFTDTEANISGMTAAEIGSAGTFQEDATTKNSYYLHIKNAPSSPSYTSPLFITSDNNLKQYPTADWASLTQGWIRETAAESTDGFQIQYNLNGSGNLRTTIQNFALTNTAEITGSVASGAVTREKHDAGDNDYRGQLFPVGTATEQNAYTFNITKG